MVICKVQEFFAQSAVTEFHAIRKTARNGKQSTDFKATENLVC